MFAARCPVVEEERSWIDEQMAWFVDQFGASWLRSPVVLPTDDFFPGAYTGSKQDVRRVVARLCAYMQVDPERVVIDFHAELDLGEAIAGIPGASARWAGAAGHYRTVNGKALISLKDSLGRSPMALIATVAHELAHERLLGEGRVAPDRVDQEPLTDLLTVYLGLGIFSANAAFEFSSDAGGWSTRRLGYLTEPMFGYALARYAWLRGEPKPDWAKYLKTNPRSFLKKGLRFLKRSGDEGRSSSVPVQQSSGLRHQAEPEQTRP